MLQNVTRGLGFGTESSELGNGLRTGTGGGLL